MKILKYTCDRCGVEILLPSEEEITMDNKKDWYVRRRLVLEAYGNDDSFGDEPEEEVLWGIDATDDDKLDLCKGCGDVLVASIKDFFRNFKK